VAKGEGRNSARRSGLFGGRLKGKTEVLVSHVNLRPSNRMLAESIIYFALFIAFVYAAYTRYFLWLDCFNELGRCYNPDGSGQVYTTSGLVWVVLAVVFLALWIKNVYRLQKNKQN